VRLVPLRRRIRLTERSTTVSATVRTSAMSKGTMGRRDYKKSLRGLQIELVKLQNHLIRCDDKILVIFEGRDSAGKDGVIKRIVEHLSPRETRVVALGKPSDRDRGSWYFQRYVPHLPAEQEFVLFNRSWYNRAGVERVMGFCTKREYAQFMDTVTDFEKMLVRSGIRLFKYYLDIGKAEQRKRLRDRKRDPLKQWKVSPVDGKALKLWGEYSRARNALLARTHHDAAPWTVVRADDKRLARLNVIRDLLSRLEYCDKDKRILHPDPAIVSRFDVERTRSGFVAP